MSAQVAKVVREFSVQLDNALIHFKTYAEDILEAYGQDPKSNRRKVEFDEEEDRTVEPERGARVGNQEGTAEEEREVGDRVDQHPANTSELLAGFHPSREEQVTGEIPILFSPGTASNPGMVPNEQSVKKSLAPLLVEEEEVESDELAERARQPEVSFGAEAVVTGMPEVESTPKERAGVQMKATPDQEEDEQTDEEERERFRSNRRKEREDAPATPDSAEDQEEVEGGESGSRPGPKSRPKVMARRLRQESPGTPNS